VCCVHVRCAHGASHLTAETTRTPHALAGEYVLCALPREPGIGIRIATAHCCQSAAPQSRLGTPRSAGPRAASSLISSATRSSLDATLSSGQTRRFVIETTARTGRRASRQSDGRIDPHTQAQRM
jgi:hypothetical protein